MYQKLRILCALGLMTLCPCGCTQPKKPALESEDSYVEMKLREAAEDIRRDLALLVGSDQMRETGVLTGKKGLSTPMDLVFDGPLSLALEKICAVAGMHLTIAGKKPLQEPIIHLHLKNRPCLVILREIGAQTGPNEDLHVLEDQKEIRLIYKQG